MNLRPDETEMYDDDLSALNVEPMLEDRWRFYTILQVPRTATLQEIEQSYRRLSKLYHTDRLARSLQRSNVANSPEEVARYMATARLTMSLLNQAKAVLTDPVRRAAYDRHGEEGLSAFESLDVAVREKASPSEILVMLDMLRAHKRQNDADVQLDTNGTMVVLVDATDYVDQAIAKWCTGVRGTARNQLLDLEEAGFGYVEQPFVKALTVQHVTNAYASEKFTVQVGGVMQTSTGLAAGRVFVVGTAAVTAKDQITVHTALTESSRVSFDISAAHRIDNRTKLEVNWNDDEEGNHKLAFSSKRQIDSRGTWVAANLALEQRVFDLGEEEEADEYGDYGGDDGDEGADRVLETVPAPATLTLSAGMVLEREARTDAEKTTLKATLKPPVGTGQPLGAQVALHRRITPKCRCALSTEADMDGGWDVEFSSTFQFDALTRFSVGTSTGQRGVKLKFTLVRGRSTFRLPILLSMQPSALVAGFAVAAPVAALLLGRWLSLPYHALLMASFRKDQKMASAAKWSEALEHAQRQQELLRPAAQSSEEAERARGRERDSDSDRDQNGDRDNAEHRGGGLVILGALYGCHSRPKSEWFDVKVVLQAAVRDARLVLPGGSTKRDLQGFLDPRDRPRTRENGGDDFEFEDEDEDENEDEDEDEEEVGWGADTSGDSRRTRRRGSGSGSGSGSGNARLRRGYDDKPPSRLWPKLLWTLRHFFALPSMSRHAVQDFALSDATSPSERLLESLALAEGSAEKALTHGSLVLSVRYSYNGKVYDIEFDDLADVILPDPTNSTRVWTQRVPEQWGA